MVIWSKFRSGKYRDDDHREDASHFIRPLLWLILWVSYIYFKTMRCSSTGHGKFSWNRVLDETCVRPNELSEDVPSCPPLSQPTIGTFACSMNAENGKGYHGEHCILTCPTAYKLAKHQNNQINCRCNSRQECKWVFQEKTKCIPA